MPMLSPEGEMTRLTATPEKRLLKSNSYSTACMLKARTKKTTEAHNIMSMSVLEFISKIPG